MVTWLRYAQFSCIFRKPFVRSGNHNTLIFLLQLSSGEIFIRFAALDLCFFLFSTVSFRDCHFVRQINFELYHHFPSFTIFPLSPFSLFHHFLIFIIFSFLHLNKRCFKSSHCIGHFGKGTKQIPFVFTSDIHTRTLIIIK